MNIRHAGVINPDCYRILKEKISLSEQNPGQRNDWARPNGNLITL